MTRPLPNILLNYSFLHLHRKYYSLYKYNICCHVTANLFAHLQHWDSEIWLTIFLLGNRKKKVKNPILLVFRSLSRIDEILLIVTRNPHPLHLFSFIVTFRILEIPSSWYIYPIHFCFYSCHRPMDLFSCAPLFLSLSVSLSVFLYVCCSSLYKMCDQFIWIVELAHLELTV